MVHDAFERYDAAVEEQFALLEQGQVAEAKEVDEQRVRPAFAVLAQALAAADRRYGPWLNGPTNRPTSAPC
jgi:hypothetical protein